MTKIIVVTRGVPERLHTLRLLAVHDIPHTVVVHSKADARRVTEALEDFDVDVVVSNTKDIVEKRNWILDNLVRKNEWFIGMDDNIREFTAVDKKYYGKNAATDQPCPSGNWRHVFNKPVSPRTWLDRLEMSIGAAQQVRAPLVGVATMENPFFRARPFSYYRFVKTKVFAMRKWSKLRFKHTMCHDSYLSALAIAEYGSVFVNSHLHYKAKMYEAGGLGNRADREKLGLIKQLESICKEFPGLVMMGRGANTALRFRLVTAAGVERWRAEHRGINDL